MNKDAIKLNPIQAQLLRIQRMYWLPTLKHLIDNFEGAISEPGHQITHGVLEVLKSLPGNDQSIDTLAIRRLQKMFCFNYRFYKGVPAVYWDPTHESFADFSRGEKQKISVYECSDSHPAADILMRWIAERFNQAKVQH